MWLYFWTRWLKWCCESKRRQNKNSNKIHFFIINVFFSLILFFAELYRMETNFKNLELLIFSFFAENKSVILSLIIISTILSVLQTNGISIVTSQLIQHITEQKNISLIQTTFFYLVVFCVIHQLFTNVYYKIRNGFVIKLKSWEPFFQSHS